MKNIRGSILALVAIFAVTSHAGGTKKYVVALADWPNRAQLEPIVSNVATRPERKAISAGLYGLQLIGLMKAASAQNPAISLKILDSDILSLGSALIETDAAGETFLKQQRAFVANVNEDRPTQLINE